MVETHALAARPDGLVIPGNLRSLPDKPSTLSFTVDRQARSAAHEMIF